MIWHIIRKDWKLLWRLVVGVALINWINLIFRASFGVFPERFGDPGVGMIGGLIQMIALLVAGVLIVLVVQQDVIPGLRQDWLTRPIRRRDLLLSKLVFVALLVQGPIFIGEAVQGLAAGFSVPAAIGAPLSRSLTMLLAVDVPLIAFAALARNLTEVLGASVALAIAAIIFLSSTTAVSLMVLGIGGIAWVIDSLRILLGLAAAAVVLWLLYSRRKVLPARWLFGAGAIVWLMVGWLPWQPAFAIQERFSARPGAGDKVRIAFAPEVGQLHSNLPYQQNQITVWGNRAPYDTFHIPLRATGVPNGDALLVDQATARLTDPDGNTTNLGPAERFHSYEDRPVYETVYAPDAIYSRVGEQPVRLEIEYSLTLLKPGMAQSMPVSGGDRWIPGVGHCVSRTSGRMIDIGCLAAGSNRCPEIAIENLQGGRIPQVVGCLSDYAPYFGRVQGDSMSRFGARVPFPSNDWRPEDIRVVVQPSQPEAHFTRKVVIQNIRLRDWRAE